MKAILTIIFVILFGAIAMAQNVPADQKVTINTPATEVYKTLTPLDVAKIADSSEATETVMVLKFRNSLIKDSLAFLTDRQRSKLA